MNTPVEEHVPTVAARLASIPEFWAHWGFEAWQHGNMQGVCRLQRFIKDGFLGPVAEYRAWDCIVWEGGTPEERELVWRNARPMAEVMTQRFLFLLENPWEGRRIRSFWCGLRGYVEFYAFSPAACSDTTKVEPKDLTDLIKLGLRVHERSTVLPVE